MNYCSHILINLAKEIQLRFNCSYLGVMCSEAACENLSISKGSGGLLTSINTQIQIPRTHVKRQVLLHVYITPTLGIEEGYAERGRSLRLGGCLPSSRMNERQSQGYKVESDRIKKPKLCIFWLSPHISTHVRCHHPHVSV